MTGILLKCLPVRELLGPGPGGLVTGKRLLLVSEDGVCIVSLRVVVKKALPPPIRFSVLQGGAVGA